MTNVFLILRTFIPWPDDTECNMFRTSFNKKKSLRLIGLASFPRSGNTWTRHMMEALTGIFTGSFYYSKMLVFQGEMHINTIFQRNYES